MARIGMMAEAETDNFLTCAICYDVIKDPRTLSCGHTFCQACLRNYTKSCREASLSRAVLCPFCRQKTDVPDPYSPIDEWTRQLKSCTLTRELDAMDAIVNRDRETEDENVCVHHGGELTLYCRNCKELLCSDCEDGLQRDCEAVALTSILPDIMGELKSTKHTLGVVSKKTEAKTEMLRSRRQKVTRSEAIARDEIRAVSETVIEAIRRREAQLIEMLRLKAGEEMSAIQFDIRQIERSAKIQHQQSKMIDKVLASESEVDKFRMHKVSSKLFFGDEGSEKVDLFDKLTVKYNITSIDEILCQVLEGVNVEYALKESRELTVEDGTINIKVDDDEEEPFLVDIVTISHLDVYAIVVNDNSNCCTRSLYKENGEAVQSKVMFPSPPWGLDRFITNQIVVSLPDSKRIARLRVTPKLDLISNISTNKSYRSVAVMDPTTLVAGVCLPQKECIDILDMEGNVLKAFTTEVPLMVPSYLQMLDRGHFLISDFGLGTVTCVSTSGIMKFTYSRDLMGPSGIAVCKSGIILLVDREEGTLVEYSKYDSKSITCPKYTPLLNKISKTPWGVCTDRFGTVYVTQGEIIRVVRASNHTEPEEINPNYVNADMIILNAN